MAEPVPSLLSPDAVWRWGQRALWGGLLSALVFVFVIIWGVPGAAHLLPLIIAGLWGGWVLFRYPLLSLSLVLIGFALVVNSDRGVQVTEVVYGLYLYAYLFYWYGMRILSGERIAFDATDWVALLLIVGGVFMGPLTGVLFGATLGDIRADLTAFGVLGLYFPVKHTCQHARRGPEVVVFALIVLGVFLGVQNFLDFRSIIASATQAWQVEDARFAATEALVMVGAFAVLFLLLGAERWRNRLALLCLLLFMLAALVLTKGRTFWLAFAFGVGLSLLFLERRQRFRLILLATAGSTALVIITVVFFGQLADLIFSGTLERLSSFEGATSRDVSLIARFIEWDALWQYIAQNPILGYGFGTTYTFYDIVEVGTVHRTFSHNGFLGAWFKLGLFGLLLLLLWWALSLYDAFRVRRAASAPPAHRSYALIALVSLAALALAANASIFFIYMNQLFLFALLTGLASGLRRRCESQAFTGTHKLEAANGPTLAP